MNKLPQELFASIADYINDNKTMLNLAQVNKDMYNTISSSNWTIGNAKLPYMQFPHIDIVPNTIHVPLNLQYALSSDKISKLYGVRHLHIEKIINYTELDIICTQLPNLQGIHMHNYPSQYLPESFYNLQYLHSMSLESDRLTTIEFNKLPSLRNIDINVQCNIDLSMFHSLDKLNVVCRTVYMPKYVHTLQVFSTHIRNTCTTDNCRLECIGPNSVIPLSDKYTIVDCRIESMNFIDIKYLELCACTLNKILCKNVDIVKIGNCKVSNSILNGGTVSTKDLQNEYDTCSPMKWPAAMGSLCTHVSLLRNGYTCNKLTIHGSVLSIANTQHMINCTDTLKLQLNYHNAMSELEFAMSLHVLKKHIPHIIVHDAFNVISSMYIDEVKEYAEYINS